MGTRTRRHLERGLVALVAFLASIARLRRLWQAVAVVGLAFYGTWLVYRPAAYLVAAALLLLDLATDRS